VIIGIGNDIIEVARIAKAIERSGSHFLDRLFTAQEQQYCQRHQQAVRHFAGRFAAKEAIAKALGTGFREGLSWLDIDIYNDLHGKPCVELSPALAGRLGPVTILLSISHCHEYATAVALIEG
jgi:holo-[acyl-carrier protein] synthase